MNFKVTVIVCTYNRAYLLKRTLSELIKQDIDCPFDILVIDNNSIDNTRQVVEKISLMSSVAINYIFEKKQGIAYARNRGAQAASGEYIAYIDDDAVPHRRWLKNIVYAFEKITPKPFCTVGKVILEWEGDENRWLPEKYNKFFCGLDFGNEPKYLGEEGYLLTLNAAFDRKRFLSMGKFRTYLGRKGKCLISGEDSDVYQRLLVMNEKIFYNPEQIVYHYVSKKRQGLLWMTRRIFWDGATGILLDFDRKKILISSFVRRIFYESKKVFIKSAILFYFFIFIERDKRFDYFFEISYRIGRMYMLFTLVFMRKRYI